VCRKKIRRKSKGGRERKASRGADAFGTPEQKKGVFPSSVKKNLTKKRIMMKKKRMGKGKEEKIGEKKGAKIGGRDEGRKKSASEPRGGSPTPYARAATHAGSQEKI